MGSSGSRPRLRKVDPRQCREDQLEPEQSGRKPQWTLPALSADQEQHAGALGPGRTLLPPLKQHPPLPTLAEPCFAVAHQPTHSTHPSIIHSHPPRRPQGLQPLVFNIGHTSPATGQMSTGMDRRGGGAPAFATPSQEGVLKAQTALSQQIHRNRRAHQRQAREQRRQRTVYPVNGGEPDSEGGQRLKLVRRTTERDIFWDEARGESMDLRHLLQPSPLPSLGEDTHQNLLTPRLLCKVNAPTCRDAFPEIDRKQLCQKMNTASWSWTEQ